MGFSLKLSTNSRDVIEAAQESWSGIRQEFDAPHLVMRVVVGKEGNLAEPGVHHKAGSLYSVVCDRYNFAHVDLEKQFAAVYVSAKTAADHSWLRWFFVESLAYLMLNQRRLLLVHAALLARGSFGVLLCGNSTAGKSTLAYACARAGWTYLSDDCSALLPASDFRFALGRPREIRFRPDAPEIFPELHGFVTRARPTGKLAIEVPTASLAIQTAYRTRVEALVFVERGTREHGLWPISREIALDRILSDLPTYGDEVDEFHTEIACRICEAPAYVLRYEQLSDGVQFLSRL